MNRRSYALKARALRRYCFLVAPLTMIMISGCDLSRQWDVSVSADRYTEIRHKELENTAREMAINVGAGWISSAENDAQLIFGFDSKGSKSFGYRCGVDASDKNIFLKSNNSVGMERKSIPNLVLICDHRDGRKFVSGIRRIERDEIVWEYSNSQDSMSISDFVYVDNEIIVANITRDYDGVSYGFIDAKTGRLIKQSKYLHMSTNSGFNKSTMSLYSARSGKDRTEDSFIMSYDYETNTFKDLAVIPNDFSGHKMTISIQPELSFSHERYLVLSISSGGRGITFAGFIVIDTITGEYLYKDYFEGGPPFEFVANDEGDLIVVKYDSEDRSSRVTHLHFN